MSQECGFFNAQLVGEEYDRVYLAEQFAAYFASFIGNGIFGKSMQQLEVVSQNEPDMSVKVLSGQAWINGWWYRNTEEYTLPIDIADGVLSRIDLIVVRWGNQERNMWLDIIKGTPSANPVAPQLLRNADYYDLQLASVSVARGALSITQAQITDTRLDNTVCGLVTGVVDQIDTTDLYNQFQQYFKEFKEKYLEEFKDWTDDKKLEFLEWFDEIKDLFSEDAIGELKTQIDYNASLIDSLYSMLKSGWEKKLLKTSDGFYIKTSNGAYLETLQMIRDDSGDSGDSGGSASQFIVVKCTEATINVEANFSSVAEVAYSLPEGYHPVMAIPYVRALSNFAQATVIDFGTSSVRVTVYNGYGTARNVSFGAHVLVEKDSSE